MNNYPNKLNVAKAIKHRSTFPLSFQHQTTQDFGKTTILHACEVMPGDEFDINVSAKAQLAPMVLPTMSNVNLYVRAFFVPFRFVWSDWEDFFSQKLVNKHGSALADTVPQISSYIIWDVFKRSTGTNPFVTAYTGSKPDFYTVISGTDTKLQLTYHGRIAKQILEGLGYVINPCVDSSKNESFSALPLLSLVKIFRDYYVNPNYDYTAIDRILSREYTSNDSSSSSYRFLHDSELLACLNFVMFGWFESDLFTSAWVNPEGPQYSNIYTNSSLNSFFDLPAIGTTERHETVYPANGSLPTYLTTTSSVGTPNSALYGISQYGLNILKAVRNFVLRRNVSGARYVDQLLSRFGIALEPNEAKRAMFLGSFESSAVIGRVDATSSGNSSESETNFGDYAGRGIIDNNGHFHFKNDKNDFGMLIFVSHLMPRTAYYQGVKPHLNHLYFNDFFNPDLEDVGTAPLPNNVVFNRYVSNIVRDDDYSNGFQNGVFGFVPNYFEYKSQLDYLTGDFAVNHLNSELKSFELMRKFRSPNSNSITQYYEDDEGLKPEIGEPVQKADKNSVAPYSRMFLTQTQDADHFIMSYFFDVRATRNCNSLGNSLLAELNEHGNDVGDIIKVRPNGKYF